MIIPELLAPAGDRERLEAALMYGADAVYLGGDAFGMRAAHRISILNNLKVQLTFATLKVLRSISLVTHWQEMTKS